MSVIFTWTGYGYSCNAPGDQSGKYLSLKDVQQINSENVADRVAANKEIAALTVERDAARAEADALREQVSKMQVAIDRIHTAANIQYEATVKSGKNIDFVYRIREICKGVPTFLPQPPAPEPVPELMPESEFSALWELVNKQEANTAQINLYRAETERRAKAAMSNTATSGKDEREGRK